MSELAGALPLDTDHAQEAWGFAELFVVGQTVLPALLYLPGVQPLRLPIRVAAYAGSLAALAWWLNKPGARLAPHPSRPLLIAAIAWLGLQIVHPATNTITAGVAQSMLYLSVLAPIFWAPELVRTPQKLYRLLALTLVCNGVNAIVGVLQVRDPQRWLPAEFSSILDQTKAGILTYVGADGQRVIRPPGLSDNPGAVCGPGMVAAVLGLIFFLQARSGWRKLAALGFAFAGLAAAYLSQVRTAVVVLVGMLVAYFLVLVAQRERLKAGTLAGVGAALVAGAFAFAVTMGGTSVEDRFATLYQDNPKAVYYQAGRGEQLEAGFSIYLAEHPLGAGLGRWGMMRTYFGDETRLDSPPLWAELQLPAWILDGGAILLLLYGAALIITAWNELRLCFGPDAELRAPAAAICAINAGAIALVFGYTPFTNQFGMQYWFLAGALHGVAVRGRNA